MNTLPDIDFETVIDAPMDVVWRNMTSEETVPHWLGCQQYKKKIGHVFYMRPDPAKQRTNNIDGATHCEILAIK